MSSTANKSLTARPDCGGVVSRVGDNRPASPALVGRSSSEFPERRPGYARYGGRNRTGPIEPDLQAARQIAAAKKPVNVEGAEWQTGLTENHAEHRVTLNGETVPSAVAASASDGWVDVVVTPTGQLPWDQVDREEEVFQTLRRRLFGIVRIERDPFE